MGKAEQLGAVLIGAAVIVGGFAGWMAASAGNTLVLVGIMVPLGLQVAFGVFLLRWGQDDESS